MATYIGNLTIIDRQDSWFGFGVYTEKLPHLEVDLGFFFRLLAPLELEHASLGLIELKIGG